MTPRRIGRVAIAGLAVITALGLSACTEDKPAAKTTTSAKATTTTAAALPPVPTVEELNAQLNTALDPSVPNEQKLDFVQGGEADPELPNRLAVAAHDAGAQVQVTEVTSFGDSVNAKANFTVNGQTNVVDVPFVADGGKWKVQKAWACTMLTNLGQQSTACA
ncbi:hypothetical protein [Nocardia caishijiensis]|uniref:Low molecular weight antigen MTB12-like C-terminal domain-containing protein n=1 Tax=Nocardia caishijiensis TaxID=184756 RepID=A0ABQ6YFX4_9NOCA|nr:hypothetical protein [Nocardia caishijiensis]KAF0842435.1 hypothetical protein FNL39_11115 [Nocardia caishijiensis]